jgi:hypothetical protein
MNRYRTVDRRPGDRFRGAWGAAIGFVYAIGGGAFGPAIIDGRRCDPAAVRFVRQWLGSWALPPHCR